MFLCINKLYYVMSYRILLVDDEPDILEIIGYNLRKEGYNVYTALNGNEALQKAAEVLPHLIILDVMMPGMDGVECCEILRADDRFKNTVITFLSARGEDYSLIAGFDAGADDYISKPIRPKVLVSRVKALLKRIDEKVTETTPVGSDIIIDRNSYLVILESGEKLKLPRKEFELLALLHSNVGRVFSRDEIFNSVWGNDVIVGDRTIDVHIRKLREKIGDEHIVTVKGVGYKFE